jgi:hypothetical protein
MSAYTDDIDVSTCALVDRLIMTFRKWQEQQGELKITDAVEKIADIYHIPDEGDHPAGPVVVFAAHLLLRCVNTPAPEVT